jgi:hypothetical protein
MDMHYIMDNLFLFRHDDAHGPALALDGFARDPTRSVDTTRVLGRHIQIPTLII